MTDPVRATRAVGDDAVASRKHRRRWWTLGVLAVSLLVVIVDDTIINVAVPRLQRELAASATALQWIVDAYILVFAGLLLMMGALGDRFGMIMPSTLSVLIDVFPREERVKAIGIWTGIASLGIPLGLIVGWWLLDRFWRASVFLLNVPIVAVALAAGLVLVPESRHPAPPRPDLGGLVLSVAALSSLVYGSIEAPARGWASTPVIGALVGAVVAGAAFVSHERWRREPMLDLRLFRNPRLGWGDRRRQAVGRPPGDGRRARVPPAPGQGRRAESRGGGRLRGGHGGGPEAVSQAPA